VDGTEGPIFDQPMDAPVVFDDATHFHVLAGRQQNLIRLDVEITSSGGDAEANELALVQAANAGPAATQSGWLWWVVAALLAGGAVLLGVVWRLTAARRPAAGD
jgi:hypothetical protein